MNEIMIDLQGARKRPFMKKIYEYIKMRLLTVRFPKGKITVNPFIGKKSVCEPQHGGTGIRSALAEGYIEAEPYRGYFVCDVEALYQLEQRNHMQEKQCRQGRTGSRDGKLR